MEYFMEYKKQWTEFEVQSLAFSILRKNLYPDYLVRGEYKFPGCRIDIAVFKAHEDRDPELKFVIEVKKSSTGTGVGQQERYQHLLGVPCIYVRGGDDAYKIVQTVQPFL
jgi:hypothetical protein